MLANALKKDGFTIISMCPGWVQTDMGQRAADEVRPPAAIRRVACSLPWRFCVHADFMVNVCATLDSYMHPC